MSKVPKNVYAVDCDDVNTKYDSPVGHTYFQSGVVFNHIFNAIEIGRVPVEPPGGKTITLEL